MAATGSPAALHGTAITGDERDNSFLLKFEKQLDALAKQLGVAKLSAFYDSPIDGEGPDGARPCRTVT